MLYLDGEHWGEADPAVHVAAIRARGEWIPGLIDLFDNGRDRLDGIRLMEIYGGLGLHLQQLDNSLESGILQVSQRMRSGRLKVFPRSRNIWKSVGCTGVMKEVSPASGGAGLNNL